MRIAVVGSGISGLVSAWLLSRRHTVTLFEANHYLGGHTHTHDVELGGRHWHVDTGFIVYNPLHYPLLTRLFAELGVRSTPTTMSFSVRNQATGLEYNATSVDALFCQRRNLVSPRFLGMLTDLVRFYRRAPRLLQQPGEGPTLGEYLAAHRHGRAFRDEHLVPLAAALWSAPPAQVLEFPMRYLVQFMANHQMFSLGRRAPWRVVCGGSARYVEALRRRWSVLERPGTPVQCVVRHADRVEIRSRLGVETFDHVVLACHSDQALTLLADTSKTERDILSAIRYHPNEVVLHTDEGLLPRHPRARAAWNALIPAAGSPVCTVSYDMNKLQGLDAPVPLVVTLNPAHAIDPTRVLKRLHYAHPLHSHASVAAQARKPEIQGQRRCWFAGAHWGWGFHEDGVRSGVEVAAALGVPWTECTVSAPCGLELAA
jgi:predicted NAD/FAD-binding protein